MNLPSDLFFVWHLDAIDSSECEDTAEPHQLYVCLLCRDTQGHPDIVRGYDPCDGIFERGGNVVAAVGGVDIRPDAEDYKCEIERELLAEFEQQREDHIVRGAN